LAVFEPSHDLLPDDERRAESLRSLVRAQPGFRAGYHLRHPDSGRLISLTLWENEEALAAVAAAVRGRPAADRRGISPTSVEIWQVDAEF
jgi:heme-degrading monooxygenase HmoA